MDFHKYFNTQYVPHTEQWATCYRVGTVVNTNMFAEAFHRTLKVIYFNRKQNRRVDYLIHTLLRIARNLIYNKLRRVELKTSTHRKCEINKRHKLAEELQKSMKCNIQSFGQKMWRIKSSSSKDTYYVLQKLQQRCDCPLNCSTCNVCIHLYTCSCLDATLHSTVCKHIHLLCMLLMQNEESAKESNGTDENEQNNIELHVPNKDKFEKTDQHKYFLELLTNDPINETVSLQENIDELSYDIKTLADSCHRPDILKTVKQHMKSARSLLKHDSKQTTDHSSCSSETEEFETTSKIAPNSDNVPQLSFHSTKKKRQSRKRWAKPTNIEEQQTKTKMMKQMISVCGICWENEDKEYIEENGAT